MPSPNYSSTKLQALFECDFSEEKLAQLIRGLGERTSPRKSLTPDQVQLFGERYGFLKRPSRPLVMAVFITKGGVLKTTLTLNLARLAALHNIRTCVVGLDMQGDVSSALSDADDDETSEDLSAAMSHLDTIRGLGDILHSQTPVLDLVCSTDLPALSYIPETPELVLLNQQIQMRNRREFWLKEYVTEPLKQHFDLILLDCSPNWNHLTTNALVACDALISPLECKIHNFRNLKFFRSFIDELRRDLALSFKHCYVPTKYAANRKLCRDILEWYQRHVPGCTAMPIRESLTSEEACALQLSVVEYAPRSPAALEMRDVLRDIWKATVGRPAVVDRPSTLPRVNEPEVTL